LSRVGGSRGCESGKAHERENTNAGFLEFTAPWMTRFPFWCMIRPHFEGGRMAKVSWNRTWSIKMRKKSRGKKGKNRTKKK
jgi:hypothetical protein